MNAVMNTLNPVISIEFIYNFFSHCLKVYIKHYNERINGSSVVLSYSIDFSEWNKIVDSAFSSCNIANDVVARSYIGYIDVSFISKKCIFKYETNDTVGSLKYKASPSAIGALTRKINKLKEVDNDE